MCLRPSLGLGGGAEDAEVLGGALRLSNGGLGWAVRPQFGVWNGSSTDRLAMPFGLSNAPAAFQRFMNNMLDDLLDHCTVSYIDNILIYSDSVKQH